VIDFNLDNRDLSCSERLELEEAGDFHAGDAGDAAG
jgi:hypothetical protein